MTSDLNLILIPRDLVDRRHSARCIGAWQGLGLEPQPVSGMSLSAVVDAIADRQAPTLLLDAGIYPAVGGVRPFLRWADRFGAVGLWARRCAAVEVRDTLGTRHEGDGLRAFLLSPVAALSVRTALQGCRIDPLIGMPEAALLLTAAILSGGRIIDSAVLLAEPEPEPEAPSAEVQAEALRLAGVFVSGPDEAGTALRRRLLSEATASREETELAQRIDFRLPGAVDPITPHQMQIAGEMLERHPSLQWRGGVLPLARLAQRLQGADPLCLRRAEAHFLVNPDPMFRQVQRGIAAEMLLRCGTTRPGSETDLPEDPEFAALCARLAEPRAEATIR